MTCRWQRTRTTSFLCRAGSVLHLASFFWGGVVGNPRCRWPRARSVKFPLFSFFLFLFSSNEWILLDSLFTVKIIIFIPRSSFFFFPFHSSHLRLPSSDFVILPTYTIQFDPFPVMPVHPIDFRPLSLPETYLVHESCLLLFFFNPSSLKDFEMYL